MGSLRSNFRLIKFGPLILLYYLSISEVDTNFENYFEILSFNIQLIIIYFWTLKRPEVLGNGHIFFAGLINDVVMGFPLGLSSITYLSVSFVATYVKNMTVNTRITTDWFTFLVAILFSNLIFFILISKFSSLSISITEVSYNTFFTLIFFPFLWFFFNLYNSIIITGKYV
jgi:cell shape-determining protein MreD